MRCFIVGQDVQVSFGAFRDPECAGPLRGGQRSSGTPTGSDRGA